MKKIMVAGGSVDLETLGLPATIDDFLPKKEFQEFLRFVTDAEFPWHRGYKVTDSKEPTQIQLRHVFKHLEYGVSNHYEGFAPIEDKFDKVVKAKLNLTFSSGEHQLGGWHYDYDKKSDNTLAILYLNDNNGFTLLEDGTRFNSKANRLVLFDNVSHTDVTQTDTEERMVLNIGFIA
jgi:hypothetical protein|tara:strand:- start:632 stop:1162 length:531 start_codon:yes stop_codon:yes gene_type:complete